VLNKTSRIVQ